MPISQSKIEDRSKKLAPLLWESQCLDFGQFTLTSGQQSPYYVDLRLLPSHPELFAQATDLTVELIEAMNEDYDSICAVPTGGLPFGTLLAYKLEKSLLYVRKEGKSHGEGRKVEGKMKEGDELLVVDDIITTGGSVIDAVESIREAGGEVDKVVVLVDRTEGATDNLSKKGIELIKVANIKPLVEELRSLGKISREMMNKVKNYLAER
ncbi:orotate phosphoribosyltransferase [Candidatus Bipolaricaulota bacterium]|nr:orotate phosphoribosyltransferase [Candidatus Bipolaricaulota bacterium]